ncbi:FAD/NAD(P)-binding protein [Falsiroseomonas oryzae]|uniref:FAD/NAD(P)-binding protein n=1 Tax=Falsiroseomonas oryzae TaxID=2766473 RepID=UPI0022EAC742|nr:FAD/NAD(P)-binding protein [Roseomonas sp. MO-31]
MTTGLETLEREVARQLDILAYPSRDWVVPRPGPDGAPALACAVIGAGQYGLAVGALLQRERVAEVALFDDSPAGREGPWATFARMEMLRTPKYLAGPECGLPALSFRAWWEAQHGAAAWERMFRVPRTAWTEYLAWFRHVTGLSVRNGWRLVSLRPAAGGTLIELGFMTPDGPATRFAATVVLATGAKGAGGHVVPAAIARAVPADRVVNALEVFDAARLRGRRVGILGAGASAFDLAIAALKEGAVQADVCVRRPDLPRDNPRRWMESAGFLGHYVDLPDAAKWAYHWRLKEIGQPPPQPTFDAAMALPGFALRTGFPWESLRWTGMEIVVEGGGRRAAYDVIGVATGYQPDMARCPELAEIVRHAARWRDRFVPPPGQAHEGMAAAPYLDRFGAFTEREPGQAPWLSRVLTIISSANLSLGPVAASVSTMKYVAPRLVEGVKRALVLDQQGQDWAEFMEGEHAELRPFATQEDAAA